LKAVLSNFLKGFKLTPTHAAFFLEERGDDRLPLRKLTGQTRSAFALGVADGGRVR